jgi:hypothetical protein
MTATTMFDAAPARRTAPARSGTSVSPSQRLKTNFAAARVSFTWLGVRKTLSPDQKAQAAEPFGAEGQFLSAGKKLLDTRHEAFQAVSSIKSKITSYWKALSLPYPESGLRLIKQDDVQQFNQRMSVFRDELAEAVENLDRHFGSLKAAARQRLGTLYNEADYPASLSGLFAVEWDFPSVEPPEYLMRLNPQLYQQEKARISARFDEAVSLAEQAFAGELAKLVEHLVERLGSEADGSKKTFRDSAVTNLREFFQRFKGLNIHSNADLDRMVETAQNAIQGIDPQAIRDNDGLRQQVATQFANVQVTLDGLLIDQPRRRILRPSALGAA